MFAPKSGDVLLRGSHDSGFTVSDAVTEKVLSSPLEFRAAIAFARAQGAEQIWRQQLDERGRPIDRPVRIVDA
jgi:hypothetical protein